METPVFFCLFWFILFAKYSCASCTLYVSCLWDLPFFFALSLHFMWKISWVPFRILQSHKALLSNWSTEIPSQIRSQNSMTSLTFLWMLEQFVTIVFATPVIRLGKLWGLLNTWSSRTNVKMVKYLFTTFMAFVPMKHVFFILISFSPLHFPAPSLSNVSTSTNAFTAAFTTLIHSYSPLYLGQRAGNLLIFVSLILGPVPGM